MNKVLEDIQVKGGRTLDNKMAHISIIDNDLVIVIDFDNARIAAMQALELGGLNLGNVSANEMVKLIDSIVGENMDGKPE